MAQEIKVRDLTTRDVFTLTRMLTNVKLPPPAGDPSSYQLAILMAALRDAQEDLTAWLAEMAGMKKADLLDGPPSRLLDIFDGIRSQEGARDFFERLLLMLGIRGKPSASDMAGPMAILAALPSDDT